MLREILVFASCLASVLAEPSTVRPCHLKDHRCISDNLAANSRCNPAVRGSIPSSYTLGQFKFETPFFNASYIDNDLIIGNHDRCYFSEFFFNSEADSLLLTIDCPGLLLQSERTLIQHYTQKEDTTYTFVMSAKYPLIRLTMNLKQANDIDLCSAFTFADVTALPIFKIIPKNKRTRDFLSPDLSHLYIYEREAFFYRAPQLAKYFINSYVCDYGCNE